MFTVMANKKTSPLQASFWLTEQEKRYIIIICAIFMLGLIARYWYLKQDKPEVYEPAGLEKVEQNHE